MPEWAKNPNDDLQSLWITLSEAVQSARARKEYDQSNESLRWHIKHSQDEGLTVALRLWLADNLMFEMRYSEAIESYREIVKNHPHLTFDGKKDGYSWAAYALERTASCQEKLGDIPGALASLRTVLSKFSNVRIESSLHYRIGRLLESAHRDDEAEKAYQATRETDKSEPGGDWPLGEFAMRQAASLKSPGKDFPTPQDCAAQLAQSLLQKDHLGLEVLASPTHFCLGVVGSESQFVDRQKALGLLAEDIKSSGDIRIDPLTFEGAGGSKTGVLTEGWKGQLLQGRVWFLLARLRAGWEWCGLALGNPGPRWNELIPDVHPRTNQPVEIGMKAPWVSGDCWRAGGLGRYLASFIPLASAFIFLEDNFSCCGYGPGGYYFNYSTHTGSHAFAIDFTRYIPGLPYLPDAHYKDVLSVQDGVVTFVSPMIVPDHDHSGEGNRVEVDSPGLSDILNVLLRGAPLILPFKYKMGYWHLAGGRPILVSVGMFVRQGARLAYSDNTGNSFFSHLHFVVQDRDLGFSSTRPSPLDGQRLGDGDAGRCVASTNVAFP